MPDPREAPTVRKVGVCSHCGMDVLLVVRRVVGRVLGVRREASCACGATQVPPSFFERLVSR